MNIVDLIHAAGLAPGKSQARRLVQQGAVRLNGRRVESIEDQVMVTGEAVLQVGKRHFVRLVPQKGELD
jgi:tyrosyl-tRNA synthetase